MYRTYGTAAVHSGSEISAPPVYGRKCWIFCSTFLEEVPAQLSSSRNVLLKPDPRKSVLVKNESVLLAKSFDSMQNGRGSRYNYNSWASGSGGNFKFAALRAAAYVSWGIVTSLGAPSETGLRA